MKKRKHTKLVHEGKYVAEVDIALIDTPEGWSPYLALEDAYRLDDVREALRKGDLELPSRTCHVIKTRTNSSPHQPSFHNARGFSCSRSSHCKPIGLWR